MEKNQYQSLLRILYRYQTNTILVYHNGKIRGLVFKNQLEEKMSDLSLARSGFDLPVNSAEMEDILNATRNSNITENGQKVIPVIDYNGRFIGLWNKKDILSTITGDEKVNIDETVTSPNNPEKKAGTDFPVTTAPPLNQQVNVDSSLDSAETISIKTLESLPIPMLAVDTRGEVLFYNQDWVMLQKSNKETLGINKLMESAKDIMAKLAFDGTLEINSVLDLPVKISDNILKMRSIIDDSKKRPEVIGYIFWSESNKTKIIEKEVIREIEKTSSPENNSDVSDTKKYLGKTLVELLREEEKKILSWAMKEADGNQSNAAMLLGIPRQTFSFRYNKIFSNKMSNKLK